jgi:hypothetical protein
VAAELAVAHIRDIYAIMQAEFPERELLIGETGWPSAGRQRQGAVPSVVNQARFIREFLAFTADAGIPYNVIEAFDQPWKRRQEGAVGGYWGLYDNERGEKFSLVEPVVEEPRWALALAVGVGVALLFWVAGWVSGARGGYASAVFLLAGYVTGCVLASQSKTLWQAARSLQEWWIGGTWTVLSLVTAFWLARALTGSNSMLNGWRVLRFVASFVNTTRFEESGICFTSNNPLMCLPITSMCVVYHAVFIPTGLILSAQTGSAVTALRALYSEAQAATSNSNIL